jgi:hypothetical protein
MGKNKKNEWYSTAVMAIAAFIVAFFFIFLTCSITEAQVVDTVYVSVQGDLNRVMFTEFETNMTIGETKVFRAVAFDSDGDTVNAIMTYKSTDPTVIQIDSITGLATALKKGTNIGIWVRAEAGSMMHMASFRDGDLDFSGNWEIPLYTWQNSLGDSTWYEPTDGRDPYWVKDYIRVPNPNPTLQFCAWLVDGGGHMVAESPGPPTCPTVWLPAPEPTNSMFVYVPRTRSMGSLRSATN